MVTRLSAPSCLVAALALAAPRVATAQPTPETSAQTPEESAAVAGPEPEPSDPPPAVDDAQDSTEPQPADDEDEGNEDEGDELEDEGEDDEIYDEDGEVEAMPTAPARLPKLQRIGWYHVLGAFTLATTAGVLAGLAERQEDRAARIASGYDAESGAATLYADRQEQYEETLDRGQALETSAIVVGALAGATTIAAITIFAIDAKRRRPSNTARRARVGPGSLEVRF